VTIDTVTNVTTDTETNMTTDTDKCDNRHCDNCDNRHCDKCDNRHCDKCDNRHCDKSDNIYWKMWQQTLTIVTTDTETNVTTYADILTIKTVKMWLKIVILTAARLITNLNIILINLAVNIKQNYHNYCQRRYIVISLATIAVAQSRDQRLIIDKSWHWQS